MEGSVSDVEVCNLAYTGQFDKLKQCIVSDKTLACKTDQVRNVKVICMTQQSLFLLPANNNFLWKSSTFSSSTFVWFQVRRTALHWASSAGHANIVEFLLDLGVEVNPEDDVGQMF